LKSKTIQTPSSITLFIKSCGTAENFSCNAAENRYGPGLLLLEQTSGRKGRGLGFQPEARYRSFFKGWFKIISFFFLCKHKFLKN
jgi:hypothetical protein